MMNKLIKLMFIGCSIIAFNSFSQDETKLNAAFLSSYDFEAKGSYDLSIKSLDEVYDKTSYIINLRLGWLNYANKNYENSIKYYQIATLLMPSSEEALWALINPLVAKEKWNDVDKAYLAIIAIDPANRFVTRLKNLNGTRSFRTTNLNLDSFFSSQTMPSPSSINLFSSTMPPTP